MLRFAIVSQLKTQVAELIVVQRTSFIICCLVVLCFNLPWPVTGAPSPAYRLEQLTSGHDVIWAMEMISPHEIIFTVKSGTASLLNLNDGQITSLEGTPEVTDSGQGGLLDVRVSPHFGSDRYLYFTYSKPVARSGATTLARCVLKGTRLNNCQDLLVTNAATDTHKHFGSRIAFDDSDHIFFTVGDRGVRPLAQDLASHAGKVLRLNLDGTVPADNPFYSVNDVQPEIYSYGHRNPQGIVFDKTSRRLWLIEHGPRGGDEINLVLPGANYGWPVVSHGKEYYAPIAVGEATEKEGVESPRKVYIPSIAPSSLILYSGNQFKSLENHLLAGALKLRHINIITLTASGSVTKEERILENLGERIRSLLEDKDGNILFSTDSGKIYRITP